MKKSITVILLISLFILTGADPWEGSAVVAPEGELPSTGYYVATDSFPRNTVVDITNIETGRSVRVMVANRLDNPALLAVVSRQAAELIGMRAGQVSQLRMVQPTEPIAYNQFNESVNSGIPIYDSGNVITEQNYRDEANRPAAQPEPEPVLNFTPPGYTLEQEWLTREFIVDLPFGYEYPPLIPEEVTRPPEQITEVPEEPEIPWWEEFVEDEPEEFIEDEPEYEFVDEPEEFIEDEPEDEFIDEPEEFVEDEPENEFIDEPEETSEGEIQEETTDESGGSTLVLVPAEERPPESFYGINPDDIIPGISIPSNDSPEPAVEHPGPAVLIDTTTFSVPRIFALESGWYYVQIAAFDSPQAVENALKLIDSSYQPKVYKDGDVWYRILLGPLNQGESAAILQRFRSIGYHDAFVRRAP